MKKHREPPPAHDAGAFEHVQEVLAGQRRFDRFAVHFGPRVTESVVIGVPPGTVPTTDGFPSWTYDARLVWIVPGGERINVVVRESLERWRVPFVDAVPSECPCALRELPEWAPSLVYVELDVPVPCPNCGMRSTRYRELRDAFVCLRCGRSFGGASVLPA